MSKSNHYNGNEFRGNKSLGRCTDLSTGSPPSRGRHSADLNTGSPPSRGRYSADLNTWSPPSRGRHFVSINFLLSAAKLEHLPADVGAEVAFIGRSNAGKSSAINAIAARKSLARVGKTPGVTQLINVFTIDDKRRLIDLPGYGYAKVAASVSQNWQHLINHYLQKRESLKGLFVLMDIRQPLKEQDCQLLSWAWQANLPVHILLTKADKLSKHEADKILKAVRAELEQFSQEVVVQLFSSFKNIGLEEVWAQLDLWLQ
jgi:GTP-binding protein